MNLNGQNGFLALFGLKKTLWVKVVYINIVTSVWDIWTKSGPGTHLHAYYDYEFNKETTDNKPTRLAVEERVSIRINRLSWNIKVKVNEIEIDKGQEVPGLWPDKGGLNMF